MTAESHATLFRIFRRISIPLAAYYAVTLALPIANGAARSGAPFVKHALAVLVVPLIVIASMLAALAIARGAISAIFRVLEDRGRSRVRPTDQRPVSLSSSSV